MQTLGQTPASSPATEMFRAEVGMMKAGKMEAWLGWSLEAEEVRYRCQTVGVGREIMGIRQGFRLEFRR